MIQARDLRLGNAFEYLIEDKIEGNQWILNIIDAEDISTSVYHPETFSKHYRPIHLTPEILEKCGFELDHANSCYEVGVYRNGKGNGLSIENEISKKTVIVKQHGAFNTSMIIHNSIRYLHQLQNLYFALTGEELTFKP